MAEIRLAKCGAKRPALRRVAAGLVVAILLAGASGNVRAQLPGPKPVDPPGSPTNPPSPPPLGSNPAFQSTNFGTQAPVFPQAPPDLRAMPNANANADVPLKLSVAGPKEGVVNQQIAFQITIQNTTKEAIPEGWWLHTVSPNAASIGKIERVAPLGPNEKRTLSLAITPNRAGSLSVHWAVSKDPALSGAHIVAGLQFVNPMVTVVQVVRFNPLAADQELLPRAPKSAITIQPRLAKTLDEIPEVAFEELLSKSMKPQSAGGDPDDFHGFFEPDGAREHIIGTIAKIEHINKKKTDRFMEVLLDRRADLAGLPFTMGDGCRLKEERSRQFGHALNVVRKVRASVDDGPLSAEALAEMLQTECTNLAKANRQCDPSCSEHVVPARVAAVMQVAGSRESAAAARAWSSTWPASIMSNRRGPWPSWPFSRRKRKSAALPPWPSRCAAKRITPTSLYRD